ncbi:MAG: hypothetical protein ACRD2B_06720, partial [Terriglobia bacterium]
MPCRASTAFELPILNTTCGAEARLGDLLNASGLSLFSIKTPHPGRGVYREPLRSAQGDSMRSESAPHLLP